MSQKIYRVSWRVPTASSFPELQQARSKRIEVFWLTDAEASAHVEALIRAFTTLGYEVPSSWVAKHSCGAGERFFE